jgi:hypothetical protein
MRPNREQDGPAAETGLASAAALYERRKAIVKLATLAVEALEIVSGELR